MAQVTIRIGDRVIEVKALEIGRTLVEVPHAPFASEFSFDALIGSDPAAIVTEGEDVTDRPALPPHEPEGAR